MENHRTLIASDGTQLAYWVEAAKDDGERTLLLLHGAASNHTRWSEFVERTELTASWNVICPDLRGNGASMTRSGLSLDVWCSDLNALLEAERRSSAVVIGHSLGAQIAVRLAHRRPERVQGLVLIDPVFQRALTGRQLKVRRYSGWLRALTGTISCLNAIGLRRRRLPDRDLRQLDEETRRALAGAESVEEIAKRYGALGPILRHMPTANYLRQALAVVTPLPPLEEIDALVLVLLAGSVSFADLAVNREEVARFRDAEVIVLDANHWPLTETPDAVREVIEGWMSRRFGAEKKPSPP